MKIVISNSSPKPIYEQIVVQIKKYILTDELKEGSLLPSIRNLARELQVSVITTKRSYEELEREGLIVTVRGKGCYVAPKNKELLREKKLKIIEEKLSIIVDESKMLGINLDEIYEMLKILFES